MIKVVFLLLKQWQSELLGKKTLTLRICKNCYYDLLVDPRKHHYSGYIWFVRLIGKLFPSPDLWILLDPGVAGTPSQNERTISAETHRQLEAYRSFVKTTDKHVILDANKPITEVTEKAYAAIIDMLVQHANRQLTKRFGALSSTACK
jgi:hypothetical protein